MTPEPDPADIDALVTETERFLASPAGRALAAEAALLPVREYAPGEPLPPIPDWCYPPDAVALPETLDEAVRQVGGRIVPAPKARRPRLWRRLWR